LHCAYNFILKARFNSRFQVGLPPGRALPQALNQYLVFACQREIVQSAKVAPFHTGIQAKLARKDIVLKRCA